MKRALPFPAGRPLLVLAFLSALAATGCGSDASSSGDDVHSCIDADLDGLCDETEPCPPPAADGDLDGICDALDACSGHDDLDDFDADGVADGCDTCPADPFDDVDGDAVCDSRDACPGADDRADADGDGAADACDACPVDSPDDDDGDGVCTSVDACAGHDDGSDLDGDGVADGCDPCPVDSADDTDGDGRCDGVDRCPLDSPDDANGDGYCDSAVAEGPLVLAVSPAAGSANGGYSVNVVGAGFLPGATVEFGSEATGWVPSASVSVLNTGTLVAALVPPHAAGAVDVRVTNTDLKSGVGAGVFTYQEPAAPLPLAFGSLSRTRGPEAGGYEVIVTGQGFAPGATVEWGSEASATWTASPSVQCVGPTLLRATVPAASAPGPVDVRITVPGFPAEQSVVALAAFTYGQSAVFETKGYRLPPDASNDDRQALVFDANGDGRNDVLVLHDGGGRDDLLLDVSDGSGMPGPYLDATATMMPDLPVSCSRWFGCTFYHTTRRWPHALDVEGDGDLDVIWLAARNSSLGLYRNGGAGTFTFEDRGWFDISGATSMKVADLSCDGKVDLFVTRNGAPDRILVGDGAGGFTQAAATVLPATSDASQGAALGDLDGDGDVDIVVANGSFQQTRVYFNNCAPTDPQPAWAFTDAVYGVTFPVSGGEGRDVALADLDLDGDLDVFLANRGQASRVYLNSGTGSFAPDDLLHFPQSEANQNAAWVAVADVDLDGDPDVVLGKDQGSGYLWPSVYLNDRAQGGSGALTAALANVPAFGGQGVYSLALGDLNGDALPDLYAVRPDQIDLLLVNRGYSPNQALEANRVPAGAFADNTLVGLPMDAFTTTGCATGDVDGDGDVDILASSNWPGGLRLWLNDGAANFVDATGALLPDADCNGGRPTLADVNGDGDLDLLAVCAYRSATPSGKGGLRQLVNDGTGRFTDVTAANVPANSVWNDLVDGAVADLDADGRPDWVAVAAGTLGYTLANGGDASSNDGAAYAVRSDWLGFATSATRTGVVLEDLNGDGFTDVFLPVSGQSQLWHNGGTGVMTNVTATHLPAASWDVRRARAADLDGDGLVDLLLAVNGASRLLRGGPGGTFSDVTLTQLPVGLSANSADAVLGDFDGDGLPDAYLTNAWAQDFLWLNTGGGVLADFTPSLPREVDASNCACAGDLDGNGRLDLFVGAADVDRVLLNLTP
jgi:hypothetical protein